MAYKIISGNKVTFAIVGTHEFEYIKTLEGFKLNDKVNSDQVKHQAVCVGILLNTPIILSKSFDERVGEKI